MIEYVFALAGVLALGRIFLGPSFADRVIALGAFMNMIIVFIALYAVQTKTSFYLDIAIVMVLLSFVGNLVIAKYAVRGNV